MANHTKISNAMLNWALRETLSSLPERRDWLNPDAERQLRATLAELKAEPADELPITRSTYGSLEACQAEQKRRDAARQDLPAHLREFVEAVANNYTHLDNMESAHCSGCYADLDDGEEHADDCIVLRARALLAANKEEG